MKLNRKWMIKNYDKYITINKTYSFKFLGPTCADYECRIYGQHIMIMNNKIGIGITIVISFDEIDNFLSDKSLKTLKKYMLNLIKRREKLWNR